MKRAEHLAEQAGMVLRPATYRRPTRSGKVKPEQAALETARPTVETRPATESEMAFYGPARKVEGYSAKSVLLDGALRQLDTTARPTMRNPWWAVAANLGPAHEWYTRLCYKADLFARRNQLADLRSRADLETETENRYMENLIRRTIEKTLAANKRNLDAARISELVEDCKGPAYLAAHSYKGPEYLIRVLLVSDNGRKRASFVSLEAYYSGTAYPSPYSEETISVSATILSPTRRAIVCKARHYFARRAVRENLRLALGGYHNVWADAVNGISPISRENLAETMETRPGPERVVEAKAILADLAEWADLLPVSERSALCKVIAGEKLDATDRNYLVRLRRKLAARDNGEETETPKARKPKAETAREWKETALAASPPISPKVANVRAAIARVLGDDKLPTIGGVTVPSPEKAKAQRAAIAEWRKASDLAEVGQLAATG
jgi:hypothetical protein